MFSEIFLVYLESIKQEETKLVKTQDDLQAHKDKAQAALDYYRQLITETEYTTSRYAHSENVVD